MVEMIKKLFTLVFMVITLMGSAIAQDGKETSSEGEEQKVTNDELRRYAIAMETVELMKQDLSRLVNEMIKNQEGVSGNRYAELDKASNEAELKEMGANETEVDFWKQVKKEKDKRKEEIQTTFKTLAKRAVGNGGKTYKEVKKAIANDPDVKQRYEKIKETIEDPMGEDNES